MKIIAFITDFGTHDHYVGAMKGAILTIAPKAQIVDISHDIERHNIAHGALVLHQCLQSFPPETVFVAVIDPGVGTDRGLFAARYADRVVVAPDNGLVSFVHGEWPLQAMHALENDNYFASTVSSTFHGRDVMAPVAAHLANGVELEALGRSIEQPTLLPVALRAVESERALLGEVVCVDAFGTLITNIRAEQLDGLNISQDLMIVSAGTRKVGSVRNTYHDVPVGKCLALVGSTGLLEIAVNQGRADEYLGFEDEMDVVVSAPS